MSRLARWLQLVALSVCVCVPSTGAAQAPGNVRIFVLNIGQGDAILIVCPHGTHRLLIDAGTSSPGSVAAFKALLTELVGATGTINVVVASHPHADHVGSLHWVLSQYRVTKFIDNGKPYTKTFAKIRALADTLVGKQQLKYFRADKFPAPSVAHFCTKVKAELLIPVGFGKASNVNNNSVAVLVTHSGVKLLFTGDAETAEEKLFLADPVVLNKLQNTSFYKIGHHGAEASTTPGLVGAMTPRIAVASAGCKSDSHNKGYRHPRAAVLDRLQTAMQAGSDRDPPVETDAGRPEKNKWKKVTLSEQLYVTSADGTVEFVSDGSSVRRVASTVTSAPGTCN